MHAQTYSVAAILLAVPVLLFILFFSESVQLQNYGSIEKVVSDQVHEVDRSIEDDFLRGIEISAKRALLAGIDSVLSTGAGLGNSTKRIEELMLSGTLYGNQSFLMLNNTLSDWQGRILSIPVIFNKSLLYSNLGINIIDGYTLNIAVWLTVNVSDDMRDIRADRTVLGGREVSIAGFEDPLFALETNNLVRRTFKLYPYPYFARKMAQGSGEGGCSGNVTFDNSTPQPGMILVTVNASGLSGYTGIISETSDIPQTSCYLAGVAGAIYLVNLSLHAANFSQLYLDNETQAVWHLPVLDMANAGYYSRFSGPHIFARLELRLNSTQPGLESFVNTQELSAAGMEVSSGKSVLDYQYFSNTPPDGRKVRGMPGWFYIDPARAGDYNFTELLEP